jgi:hypothetical protein
MGTGAGPADCRPMTGKPEAIDSSVRLVPINGLRGGSGAIQIQQNHISPKATSGQL